MAMSKRQRLEAALSGALPDRVPVAVWRHWPGDDQRPADLAAAHVAFQRRYDWDFVKVSPSSSYSVQDWGVESVWDGDHPEGTRRYVKRAVHRPDGWLALKPLDPTKSSLGRQLDCLTLLNQAFGDEVPVIQTVFSPLSQARYLAGDQRLRLDLRQSPNQLRSGLEVITETTLRFIDEAKATGMAGIYYAVQYANYDRLGEEEYAAIGLPFDLRIAEALDGLWLNVLHLHAPYPMLRLFADFPVQVINWHDRESDPDLATGLSQFGGAASGGINRDVLLNENPEPALAQAREAIAETGGRRFILGTGCVTLVTTPVGNLHKLRALVDDA